MSGRRGHGFPIVDDLAERQLTDLEAKSLPAGAGHCYYGVEPDSWFVEDAIERQLVSAVLNVPIRETSLNGRRGRGCSMLRQGGQQ